MKERGLTLIELAVALSIAVVLTGLVVVRVEGWSSRQELRGSARALGNVVRTYREKAILEERVYYLTLNLEGGRYKVELPAEAWYASAPELVRSGRLGPGTSFGKVTVGGTEVAAPVVLALHPRGALPEVRIALKNGVGEEVVLALGALVNEVAYSESP